MEIRKILVTGGAGYIGSNLIRNLIKEFPNSKIVSLDCYFSGSKNNHINSSNVEYIVGETWNINDYLEINDFDVIYHFGEYSRIVYSFEDLEFVGNSIVKGTLEVLKFALKNNSKLIYSASSSKFGNNGKDENLSPYAFFKSKNVELIKNFKNWFGLNFEICYFFNVYGKNHIKSGKYATVIAIFEEQYKRSEELTVVKPGNQSRDFTHIDDICNGLIAVTKKQLNKEYHLRYGKNYEIENVARMFSNKIKYINERPGERFTSEYFASDTKEILEWEAKIELEDYILRFKKKNELC